MAKYKIWWQSSTVIERFPEYKKAIENHAQRILSPDFALEVHGVPPSSKMLQYMSFEFLNNKHIMDNMFEAAESGYDAIALGCALDPLLEEAREVLDIPVLGFAETAMLWGCMYGKRATFVTYDSTMGTKRITQRIQDYGLRERMAPVTSFDVSLEALAMAFNDPQEVLKTFSDACHRAVEQGAEVILPGCGLLNLVAAENKYTKVGDTGATVLDVSGALMKTTESAIVLQKVSGLDVSRSGYYKSPGKDLLNEVRGMSAHS